MCICISRLYLHFCWFICICSRVCCSDKTTAFIADFSAEQPQQTAYMPFTGTDTQILALTLFTHALIHSESHSCERPHTCKPIQNVNDINTSQTLKLFLNWYWRAKSGFNLSLQLYNNNDKDNSNIHIHDFLLFFFHYFVCYFLFCQTARQERKIGLATNPKVISPFTGFIYLICFKWT